MIYTDKAQQANGDIYKFVYLNYLSADKIFMKGKGLPFLVLSVMKGFSIEGLQQL